MRNIVLIGPTGGGKTTIAPALAEALGVPWLELDDLRWDYYAEIGYSPTQAEEIQRDSGVEGLLEYWKPFELHSVQRLLEDHPSDHLLAFGGGQSVYTNDHDVDRVAETLANSHVVLLLPAEDLETSVSILLRRIRIAAPELPESMMASVERMAREQFLSTSNRRLASHVVYTGSLSEVESVNAVLAALS